MKFPSFLIFTFFSFLASYAKIRAKQAFFHFEQAKDFLVEHLYRQRGKLVRPFLHSGMAGLMIVGILLAPVVKSAIPQEEPWQEGTGGVVLGETTDLNQALTTKISFKPRDSVVVYQVREGDTLSDIAQKFGVSLDTIRWQNNLESIEAIKPGQILEIPPVTGIVHKVKRGETIYSIAKKYDIDAQLIVNWPFNSFANDETFALDVGQLLVVPEGVMPEVKPWEQRRYVAYQTEGGAVTGTGQFVWPASGGITQYPVWYHMAIDISNNAMPDILAADSGQIIACNFFKWGYGNHVMIDHGNGFVTLYGHLSSIYVNPGQSIGRGQAIGRMGSTGRSSGVHLHFEIRLNGVLQNPLNYLQ